MSEEPEIWVVVCQNDKEHPRWGVDPFGPLVLETYTRTATRREAMRRVKLHEIYGACRIARLVFDDQPKPISGEPPAPDALGTSKRTARGREVTKAALAAGVGASTRGAT